MDILLEYSCRNLFLFVTLQMDNNTKKENFDKENVVEVFQKRKHCWKISDESFHKKKRLLLQLKS